MKLVVCAVLLTVGCHKEPAGGPPPATGSAATGSAAAGSAAPTAGSAAPTAGSATAPLPDAREALDAFDRQLAPIWALPAAGRLAAFCKAQPALQTAAAAIQHLAAPAGAPLDRWRDETTRLTTTLGGGDLCCKTSDDSCLTDLRDVFTAVVGLVPGAAPIDSHKDAPMPAAGSADPAPTPAGAGSKTLGTLQAAEAVLAAAAGSKATAPAALCKTGHDAVTAVETLLNAPGLDVPASIQAAWSDELGALLMNAGAFDGQHCVPGKLADAATIKDALAGLRDRAAKLVALLAKAK